MKNWAGNITWNPSEIARPNQEEAIQKLVLHAANHRKKVRIIGTGHSFTPLCQTDDIMISLDEYQGLVSVDKDKKTAVVKGGTKLKTLGELLFKEGLAMENLGDIDVQSIAGTISTGTHGTGIEFGTISTQVIALQFVNGKGEIVFCSENENRELFKAAQVSMGTFGIITEVTLQCVSAYKLAIDVKKELMVDVMNTLDDRNNQNRNFEFFWMPFSPFALTKTTNLADNSEPDKVSLLNYYVEYFIENFGLKVLGEFSTLFPSQNIAASNFATKLLSDSHKIFHSNKVYATKRLVRFKEMEYNIPADAYFEVWKEVEKTIRDKKFKFLWPIENRYVKSDDILMSPAYGRDSAYIAFHTFHKKDHKPYFDAMEEICLAHGGRPHWGKMNSLVAKDVDRLYPEFKTFNKHRKEQDPDKIFVSPYIQKLFGE